MAVCRDPVDPGRTARPAGLLYLPGNSAGSCSGVGNVRDQRRLADLARAGDHLDEAPLEHPSLMNPCTCFVPASGVSCVSGDSHRRISLDFLAFSHGVHVQILSSASHYRSILYGEHARRGVPNLYLAREQISRASFFRSTHRPSLPVLSKTGYRLFRQLRIDGIASSATPHQAVCGALGKDRARFAHSCVSAKCLGRMSANPAVGGEGTAATESSDSHSPSTKQKSSQRRSGFPFDL